MTDTTKSKLNTSPIEGDSQPAIPLTPPQESAAPVDTESPEFKAAVEKRVDEIVAQDGRDLEKRLMQAVRGDLLALSDQWRHRLSQKGLASVANEIYRQLEIEITAQADEIGE